MFLLPYTSESFDINGIPVKLAKTYILNIQESSCSSTQSVFSIDGMAGPTIDISKAAIKTPIKSRGMMRLLLLLTMSVTFTQFFDVIL